MANFLHLDNNFQKEANGGQETNLNFQNQGTKMNQFSLRNLFDINFFKLYSLFTQIYLLKVRSLFYPSSDIFSDTSDL